MANDRFLRPVGPRYLLVDGTINGLITLPSTDGFKNDAVVRLAADGLLTLSLEVKEVISGSILAVGPISDKIYDRVDISAYTVLRNANLSMDAQSRPDFPQKADDDGVLSGLTIDRATYEESPAVARRSMLVDSQGNPISSASNIQKNPLDVNIVGGSITIPAANLSVDISAAGGDSTQVFGKDPLGAQKELFVDAKGRLATTAASYSNMIDVTTNELSNGTQLLGGAETEILSLSCEDHWLYLSAWYFVADRYCEFSLQVVDNSIVSRIIRGSTNSASRPWENIVFPTNIKIQGIPNRFIKVIAKRLSGFGGHAGSSLNGFIQEEG